MQFGVGYLATFLRKNEARSGQFRMSISSVPWTRSLGLSGIKPSSPWVPRGTYASSPGCQEEKTPKFMRKRPENSWRQANSQGICCPMVYRLSYACAPASRNRNREVLAVPGSGTQKFRMTSNSDRYERQTIRLSFIYALLSDRIRP